MIPISVQVNIPAESGDMGVLASHVPSIEQLKPGLVEVIEESGGSKQFFCGGLISDSKVSGGFATVQSGSKLSINAVEGYPLDNFNAEAVRNQMAEAQKIASGSGSEQDIAEAKIELERVRHKQCKRQRRLPTMPDSFKTRYPSHEGHQHHWIRDLVLFNVVRHKLKSHHETKLKEKEAKHKLKAAEKERKKVAKEKAHLQKENEKLLKTQKLEVEKDKNIQAKQKEEIGKLKAQQDNAKLKGK
ncbi:MAG: hypothetical protein Q9162_006920 [Coniocarpon cinnabarinum]